MVLSKPNLAKGEKDITLYDHIKKIEILI